MTTLHSLYWKARHGRDVCLSAEAAQIDIHRVESLLTLGEAALTLRAARNEHPPTSPLYKSTQAYNEALAAYEAALVAAGAEQ